MEVRAPMNVWTGLVPIVLVGLAALSCSEEVERLAPGAGHNSAPREDQDMGRADVVDACPWGDRADRPNLEVGRQTGDGCNECTCQPDLERGFTTLQCTLKLCRPYELRCVAHSDCGTRGFCHFDPGCEGMDGYCTQPLSICAGVTNPEAPGDQEVNVFCGCDGLTYEGERCFCRPWRRRGRC